MNIDADILLWINGHYADWLDTVMWIISRANTWIPLYVLLVGLIAWKYRNWRSVLLILIGFGIGGLYGFCSSHAANSMAIALLFSLLYKNKTATALLMLWVAVVCYSRMYLGAHYPTDIICGLVVGSLWAVLTWLALCRWLHVDDAVARRGDS